jgi:hypothetical protein
LDEAALHEDARSHLGRLGLLALKFRRPHGKELPEFDDKTGMMKATSVDLTQLGRLLLRQIGLAGPDEF